MVNMEIKAGEMVTGQECGLVVVDVTRGCPEANRASLGYIVSLSESVKDRSLHLDGYQVTDLLIPSIY
jgi:hypothetical protein